MSWLKKNKENKPVLFINSALSIDEDDKSDIFDFFVLLTANLSIEFHKAEFDVVMKVPRSQDTAAKEQNLFIISLLENLVKENRFKDHYSGIVIAPFDKDKLRPNLIKFVSSLKDNEFPVITIDKGFETIETIKPDVKIPYVICDGKKGGKVAAGCFIEYFESHTRLFEGRKPQIIILEGLQCSEERSKGFTEKGKLVFDIFGKLSGEYKRSKAKEVVKDAIESKDKVDGFFCCNDEMALGVRDAIEEYKERLENKRNRVGIKYHGTEKQARYEEIDSKISRLNEIRIVGYDGIKEVRVLLKQPNEQWLLNSVDVQVSAQVQALKEIYCSLQDPDKYSTSFSLEEKIEPTRVVVKQDNN
jgi:ABC-type sugar transport system substrate-binding protein